MSVDDFQNSPASRPAAMVEPRVSHWPINSGLWLPCKSNGSCTGPPFQTDGNGAHGAQGAGRRLCRAHIKRPRQRLRFFQARIINTFKEIFNQPAHVTKVFGRADNNGVGRQHILHTAANGNSRRVLTFSNCVAARQTALARCSVFSDGLLATMIRFFCAAVISACRPESWMM